MPIDYLENLYEESFQVFAEIAKKFIGFGRNPRGLALSKMADFSTNLMVESSKFRQNSLIPQIIFHLKKIFS